MVYPADSRLWWDQVPLVLWCIRLSLDCDVTRYHTGSSKEKIFQMQQFSFFLFFFFSEQLPHVRWTMTEYSQTLESLSISGMVGHEAEPLIIVHFWNGWSWSGTFDHCPFLEWLVMERNLWSLSISGMVGHGAEPLIIVHFWNGWSWTRTFDHCPFLEWLVMERNLWSLSISGMVGHEAEPLIIVHFWNGWSGSGTFDHCPFLEWLVMKRNLWSLSISGMVGQEAEPLIIVHFWNGWSWSGTFDHCPFLEWPGHGAEPLIIVHFWNGWSWSGTYDYYSLPCFGGRETVCRSSAGAYSPLSKWLNLWALSLKLFQKMMKFSTAIPFTDLMLGVPGNWTHVAGID